jgi:hypothetical protein
MKHDATHENPFSFAQSHPNGVDAMTAETPLVLPDDVISTLERLRQLLSDPVLAPLWRQGWDHYTEISALFSAGAFHFLDHAAMERAVNASSANVTPAASAIARLLGDLDAVLDPRSGDPLLAHNATLAALRRVLPLDSLQPQE